MVLLSTVRLREPNSKFNSNGGLGLEAEFVSNESGEKIGLSDGSELRRCAAFRSAWEIGPSWNRSLAAGRMKLDVRHLAEREKE